MIEQKIATILISTGSIAGILYLALWGLRDYRVNRFRHEMFALRDQLFDEAAGGQLSFDSPVYGLLRSTINGFIRFGHRIGLTQFIVFAVFGAGVADNSFSERLEKGMADLPEEARNRIQLLATRMNVILLRHIALGSPMLLFAVLVVALPLLVKNWIRAALLQRLSRPIDEVDTAALAYGGDRAEELAAA